MVIPMGTVAQHVVRNTKPGYNNRSSVLNVPVPQRLLSRIKQRNFSVLRVIYRSVIL